MENKRKKHFFNKVKYTVEWEKIPSNKKTKIYGLCDPPDVELPTITINTNQGSKQILNTYIHEALHACKFDLSEKDVTKIADDISSFLWKLGYRKKD